MNQTALDRFGELLMSRVRDEAIVDWDMILTGQMKDRDSQRISNAIDQLSPSVKALISELVPQIVDTALHHLLWTIEQNDTVEVRVQGIDGGEVNIAEASDGLSGELYDWLPRFSKQRYQNPADST
jgi:hypothetical protein